MNTGSVAITKGTVVVQEQTNMLTALLEQRRHFW
jgi:hypothetical protein